jgi:hypothetical protein
MITNGPFRLARALAVTGAAIVLAILSWMSASDRATAHSSHPEVSYLGGPAAAQLALVEITQHNPKTALSAARRAVRTAPIDPAATSSLGSAWLVAGGPEQAYAAFAVAGSLGWRDVPTQLYWLAQAAAVGNVDIVAQRLDALLRLDIDNELVSNSLDMLGRTPLGQQALATLLMKDPPWEHRFLIGASYLEGADLQGRMAAIDLAARNGASLDCEAVGIAANALIRPQGAATAKQFWRQACERSGDALLSNGGFETDPATTSHSPFTWRLQSEGGLDVSIEPAPDPLRGHALNVTSSKTARTAAALQLTALQPGRYRLSWMAVGEGGQRDTGMTVLVKCGRRDKPLPMDMVAASDRSPAVSAIFIVPRDCPIQRLVVQKAASSPGQTETAWIDDIEIAPLAS